MGTPAISCQHQCGDLGGSEGTRTRTRIPPRERNCSLPLLVPRGLPAPALPHHPRGAGCGSPGIHGDRRLFPPAPPPLLRCSRRAAATGAAASRRRHRRSGPGERDGGRDGGAPSLGSRSPPAVASAWQRCSPRSRVRPAEVSAKPDLFYPPQKAIHPSSQPSIPSDQPFPAVVSHSQAGRQVVRSPHPLVITSEMSVLN